MDEVRARYLRDRVMTATPAQRVVMLFDRLSLDLTRAQDAVDGPAAGEFLGHASTIVAELLASLDMSAGGPADNLAQLYGFLIGELTAIRTSDERTRLTPVVQMVADLREAFAIVAATVASTASTAATLAGIDRFAVAGAAAGVSAPATATAWVG